MKEKSKLYPWRTIASFLWCFCHALGSCADDIDGEVYGRGRHACSRVCDGFRGACPRYRRRVCEGRHPTNAVGTLRWTAFWTGWVEFLFLYYARRYGVPPEIENGVVVTKPEYLIMPASFGLWMMVMTMYVFSTKNGCDLITWIQRYVSEASARLWWCNP